MFNSLRFHGLQNARLLYTPVCPGICSNSYPLSWWYYLTIWSFAAPFSSCPKSFPTSESFQISWLFASGGQSIQVSASASVLPMNIQGWFPLRLTGLISLQSNRFSWVFSNTIIKKHQFFSTQPFLWSNYNICTWLLERTTALTRQIFVSKVMSLLFNMLSRFVLAFLPRRSVFEFHGSSHHPQWFWSTR